MCIYKFDRFEESIRGKMELEEAKILLGFPPNSRPDHSQVKAAYRKKVWESHPDRFPDDQKLVAESKFKSIAEAYSCLESGAKSQRYWRAGMYSRVVKTGVPRTYTFAKRGNPWLIGTPFLLIVLGTIGLGGIKAKRAYNVQKETFPSHNPFLP